ncbi:MAG: hypothetical protein U0Q15_00195 [Kineosporiaceae bacterium]
MPPATPESGGELAASLAELRAWAHAVTGLPAVHAVGEAGPAARVLLHPLGLAPRPSQALTPMAGRVVVSAELTASVLVTVVGGEPDAAACAAADLALDALAGGRDLAPDGPAPHVWAGLGLPPAAAFVVEVPVRRLLPRAPAPLVRQPLRTDLRPSSEPPAESLPAPPADVPPAPQPDPAPSSPQ